MIVKDESKVIRRCLSSVKNIIDYWVIVDTGSTDGTQNIIKEYLKEIPGRLVERPWVDFAHNRNEALALARGFGDYFLIIDADDSLVFSEGCVLPDLTKDIYYAIQQVKIGNLIGNNTALFLLKDLPDFRWEGVLHEVIVSDSLMSSELLTGVASQYGQDGFRSQDPNKYAKDALVLEQALEADPENSRNLFYLATAYMRIGEYAKALKAYEKRSSMGGADQEVFCSLFSVATLQNTLQMEPSVFIQSYCKAYQFRPSRIEPLCELIDHYIKTKSYLLGYLLSKEALTATLPRGDLFLKESLYDWGVWLQFYICADQMGMKDESEGALQKLLSNANLPDEYRSWIKKHSNR